MIWVYQTHVFESGQMVLKELKGTYFDAYLWQTMWNHAKKSMEELKLPDLVFLQGDGRSSVLETLEYIHIFFSNHPYAPNTSYQPYKWLVWIRLAEGADPTNYDLNPQ